MVQAEDITHQREARESRARLAAVVDASNDPIYSMDLEGRITSWNRGAERFFGYRAAEALGMSALALAPPHLAAAASRDLERARHGQGSGPYETQQRRKDGSLAHVSLVVSPIIDHAGQPIGASAISRDISERIQHERELEERERRFRAVFDHALEAMLIIDDDRRLRHANAAAARLLGRSIEELLSLRVDELTAPELRSLARERFQAFKRAGQLSGEQVLIRPDGHERHVEYSATADILPGRHLTVLHDVTERTREQSERAALEAQLQQAQRLESVGKLAGGVAHDFNNLLSIILNYTHYAREKAIDPELREELTEVIRAAERAASLTRQLLIFSRGDAANPQVIDLCPAVRQAVELMRRTLGERILVETDLPTEPMPILLDRAQLDQVLLNLAVNARDAMPQGGRLRFSARAERARLSVPGAAEERSSVHLIVSDTGEGMDSAVLTRAFDPFFSTKPRDAGTGLGLATVYGIVSRSGGSISLRSQVGVGTTVEISWPAASPQAIQPEAADEHPTSLAGDRTVLVVEDEGGLRRLIERILREHGYGVIAAASAEEALADGRAEEADLLLTDVVMPGLQGPQLAELLRRDRPGLPVLFVSGYSDQAGELAGAGHVLAKPFSASQLLRSVGQALAEAGDGGRTDEVLPSEEALA